jgi:hypothetical protein
VFGELRTVKIRVQDLANNTVTETVEGCVLKADTDQSQLLLYPLLFRYFARLCCKQALFDIQVEPQRFLRQCSGFAFHVFDYPQKAQRFVATGRALQSSHNVQWYNIFCLATAQTDN